MIIDRKPVVDGYYRKKFQRLKDQYAAQHADDLKESKRAYAFLMKNHDQKLEVKPDEFKAQLEKMASEDAAATAELERIKEDLLKYKTIKKIMGKVDPEVVGEKRSFREELARLQEEIRRRDEERKNRNAKKHEQARQ